MSGLLDFQLFVGCGNGDARSGNPDDLGISTQIASYGNEEEDKDNSCHKELIPSGMLYQTSYPAAVSTTAR